MLVVSAGGDNRIRERERERENKISVIYLQGYVCVFLGCLFSVSDSAISSFRAP